MLPLHASEEGREERPFASGQSDRVDEPTVRREAVFSGAYVEEVGRLPKCEDIQHLD